MKDLLGMPVEILTLVAECVDDVSRHSLLALALSCKALQHTSGLILYRSIVSVDITNLGRPGHTPIEGFEHILKRTRILSIRTAPNLQQRSEKRQVEKTFRKFIAALDLGQLHLFTMTPTSVVYNSMWTELADLPAICPALRHLYLGPRHLPSAGGGHRTASCSAFVEHKKFELGFSHHANLDTIETILEERAEGKLSGLSIIGSRFVPSLNRFLANIGIADKRDVTSLHLVEVDTDINKEPMSLSSLESVQLYDCNNTPEFLDLLKDNAQNLRVLHFARIYRAMTDHSAVADGLIELLKSKTELTGLNLQLPAINDENAQELATHIPRTLNYVVWCVGGLDLFTMPDLHQLIAHCQSLNGLGMHFAEQVWTGIPPTRLFKDYCRALGEELSLSKKLRHVHLLIPAPLPRSEAARTLRIHPDLAYKSAAHRIFDQLHLDKGSGIKTLSLTQYTTDPLRGTRDRARRHHVCDLWGEKGNTELSQEDEQILRGLDCDHDLSVGNLTARLGKPLVDLRPERDIIPKLGEKWEKK
ncbi:hypothetical protein BDV95DRAFT_602221 [Massariosphaeria phaeospora]|uniref:Uncharacterized protein n=1 Tax=Massariosphaeria phaeospora TaxID=100035 RepID=A0A7C8IFX4_9PLEO|nr:hypothetical protein BDV95DRAFT_602221 [Massariosphaeria phaeospora]